MAVWVPRTLAWLLAAGMEAAAIFPTWALLARAAAGPMPPGWWAPAVVLSAAGVAALAAALAAAHRLPLLVLRVVLALGGAAAVVSVWFLPVPGFGLSFWTGVLWWRGVAVAQYSSRHWLVVETALWLSGLQLATLVWQVLAGATDWGEVAAPYYLWFAACALGAMAAARLAALVSKQEAAGAGRSPGSPGPSDRPGNPGTWLATAGGMAMLLAPALVAWVIAQPHQAGLARLLQWVGQALVLVLTWVLGLVIWILTQAAHWLHLLLTWLGVRFQMRTVTLPQRPPLFRPEQWGETGRNALPPWLVSALGVLAAVAFLSLVAVVIYRSVFRLLQNDGADGVPETRQSTFAWRKLWRRHRRLAAAPAQDADLDSSPAARIRRLYRQLQATGAGRGRARGAAETPQEYEAALTRAGLPGRPLAVLTRLYMHVRYGDVAPDAPALAGAEDALRALRSAAQPGHKDQL